MTNVQLKRKVGTGWEKINPLTKGECVTLQNGNTVEEELSALDSDCFSPTITQISTMSKVGVGENDVDISANVQEGYVKSAILKGQTLVNLANLFSFDDDVTTSSYFIDKTVCETSKLQVNKPYLICFKPTVKENLNTGNYVQLQLGLGNSKNITLAHPTVEGNSYTYNINHNEWNFIKVTFKDFLGYQYLTVRPLRTAYPSNDKPITYNVNEGFMLLEYQQDMENWDIPFFRGMQSVKMPVLTTIGKNLFNMNAIVKDDFELDKYQRAYYGKEFILQPNTTYTIKAHLREDITSTSVWTVFNVVIQGKLFNVLNVDKTGTGGQNEIKQTTFTTDSTGKVGYSIYSHLNSEVSWLGNLPFNIQLEKSSIVTSYEPYKTNILTVNEDVTLRGIGDVKDTLDCLTGEMTERIGEIVLDGSEDWVIYEHNMSSVIGFYTSNPLPNVLPAIADNQRRIMLSDTFVFKNQTLANDEEFAFISTSGKLNLNIKRSKLDAITAVGFKSYLSKNPITIQYQLSNTPVKTVDLTPGGTNPTTKPYVWDGGHIQLSSEEGSLTPSLEYSVTTSRGGQIIQNTQSIAKQDKRVYDLEMLLINASIDEAYKRLTLQNDVMVMNRECQTVASPLRYIMLQRLIEEKAYETQDMLDKLDVFFMYGEITDEQYFELFDIVLGIMTDTDLDITEEVE